MEHRTSTLARMLTISAGEDSADRERLVSVERQALVSGTPFYQNPLEAGC